MVGTLVSRHGRRAVIVDTQCFLSDFKFLELGTSEGIFLSYSCFNINKRSFSRCSLACVGLTVFGLPDHFSHQEFVGAYHVPGSVQRQSWKKGKEARSTQRLLVTGSDLLPDLLG